MNCPHCQQPLKITAHLAGKRVKCSQCGNAFVVPPPPPPPPLDYPTIEPEVPETQQPLLFDTSRNRTAKNLRSTGANVKSWLARHIAWSGTRSFIFQTILLAWTVFMFLVGFGLMLSVAASTRGAMDSQFESDRTGAAGAFMFVGLCCPLGVYLLLAIPLGIAAIATLESKKK